MEMFRPVYNQQQLTIDDLSQDIACLERMDSIDNPLGYHDNALVRIEMYSRMICFGISNPFPSSRHHLAFALLGIKNALRQVSLTELVLGSSGLPQVDPVPVQSLRPEIRRLPKLDALLDSPMIAGSLPTLREALRFVHSRDQKDIYTILSRKLQGAE